MKKQVWKDGDEVWIDIDQAYLPKSDHVAVVLNGPDHPGFCIAIGSPAEALEQLEEVLKGVQQTITAMQALKGKKTTK